MHAARYADLATSSQEMKVIRHQAPGIHEQAEVVRDTRQTCQEVVTIVGIAEDLATLDAAGDYMVHGIRCIESC